MDRFLMAVLYVLLVLATLTLLFAFVMLGARIAGLHHFLGFTP